LIKREQDLVPTLIPSPNQLEFNHTSHTVKAIQDCPILGWGWVEWGGVGLARLHFWLQNADFDR